ncbi:MAG: hypothetical protein ACTSPE_00245 [Candidatus Thorarchaeota archaeon]
MRLKKTTPRPNEVMIRAIMKGLSAVAKLSRDRKNRVTKRYAEEIAEIWKRARERYNADKNDFSPIRNAEPNLRRLFLKMVWESTRRFGNVERKRVYSWREGTVGPLNTLLNYAGARLRELAVTQYPFPEPKRYQIRVYRDGRRVVLNEHMAALRDEDDGAVKVYWRAGYPASRNYPRVLLAHPTLPSLDFVDMIRAHVVELVRQCFIHNVPRTTAQAYIDRLIHELTPFLEYVYTGGRRGRRDFFPDADRVLRAIVLEIRANHGERTGRRPRLTTLTEEFRARPTVEVLRQRALQALKEVKDGRAVAQVQDILDQIDRNNIRDEDVDRLLQQVTTLAQHAGNDWHRVLLSHLPHPPSLQSVVLHGDELLDHPADTLVVAELPVGGEHGGVADLVLSLRRTIDDRVVWTPIAVLELKTKTAFDFTIVGVRPRTERFDTRVPHHVIERRPLTDSEWERAVLSTPSLSAERQLDLYCTAILHQYSQVVPYDPEPPNTLWRGVILVDTTQPMDEAHQRFERLLLELSEELLSGGPALRHDTDRTLYTLPGDGSRLAAIILPLTDTAPPAYRESLAGPPAALPEQDPFAQRTGHRAFFTLYVAVASPTSYGRAAATVATRWHLINHIDELCATHGSSPPPAPPPPRIVWLDLLGRLPRPDQHRQLLYRRLGLDLDRRSAGASVSGRLLTRLRRRADTIQFVDLHEAVTAALRRPTRDQFALLERLMTDALSVSGRTVVVVDGWDQLVRQRPLAENALRALEERLVTLLDREGAEVFWIDTGVPDPRMSATYQTHRVRPLPHDSPRGGVIDEIIWNLPLPPRVAGWRAPVMEDVRVIVQDLPTVTHPWSTTIHVPQLRGWSARFRAAAAGRGPVSDRALSPTRRGTTVTPMYGRGVTLSSVRREYVDVERLTDAAMGLLPSLGRSRGTEERASSVLPQQSEMQRQRERETPRLEQKPLPPPDHALQGGIVERLTLRPAIAAPLLLERHKYRYSAPRGITRSWRWRHPHIDEDTPVPERVTHRPPVLAPLSGGSPDIDTVGHRRRELRRLMSAVRFLLRQCTSGLEHGDPLDALRRVAGLLASREESREVWVVLRSERERLADVLTLSNHRLVERRRGTVPDLFLLYGNALLLLITALVRRPAVPPPPGVITRLWQSVAQWVLVHMGLRVDRDALGDVTPRYSVHALYSNLSWRMRQLTRGPGAVAATATDTVLSEEMESETVTESESAMARGRLALVVRRGLLVVMEDYADEDDDEEWHGGVQGWLVVPGATGSGQWHVALAPLGVTRGSLLRSGWTRGVTDHARLCEAAERAVNDPGCEWLPLALVRTGDGRWLLWSRTDDDGSEEETWQCHGVMEHASPVPLVQGQRVSLLRWFRTSLPRDIDVTQYRPDDTAVDWEAREERVREVLEAVLEATRGVVHVRCWVTLDPDRGVYEVALGDGDLARDRYGTYTVRTTRELVAFLRSPMDSGLSVELPGGGGRVSWDPMRDVRYDTVVTAHGLLPLTVLKPWVERREPLGGLLMLPEDVSALLDGFTGERLTMVFAPEVTGGVWRCTRVVTEDGAESSALAALRSRPLDWGELALLAAAGAVYDTVDGRGHLCEVEFESGWSVRPPVWVMSGGHRRLREALHRAGYLSPHLPRVTGDADGDGEAEEEVVLTVEQEEELSARWCEAQERQRLVAESHEGEQPDEEAVAVVEVEGEVLRGGEWDVVEWVRGRDGLVLRLWSAAEGQGRDVTTRLSLRDLRQSGGVHEAALDELLCNVLQGSGVELDDELYDAVRAALEEALREQGVRVFTD